MIDGAQALRHHERHHDMHDQEQHDRRHGEEMHVARQLVAAEQRRQPPQLHRLPHRKPRQHHHDPGDDDADIGDLLHRIVDREIVVRELAAKRQRGVGSDLARPHRQKLAPKTPGCKSERKIDEAVDGQHPHRREVPEQPAGKPAADGDALREFKPEQRRRVVDLPAGADHHQHGGGIDPMRDAQPERMNGGAHRRRRNGRIGGFGGHGEDIANAGAAVATARDTRCRERNSRGLRYWITPQAMRSPALPAGSLL